jgi:putative glutamine amidotransferase
MISVAVSQRVFQSEPDNVRYDSLDQRWVGLLAATGLLALPIPNGLTEVGDFFRATAVSGIILTGGNDLAFLGTPSVAVERDVTESAALRHAIKRKLPVLGVCRGAQLIVHFFGGHLIRLNNHAGTMHTIETRRSRFLRPPSRVCSYHDYGIDDHRLPESLEPVAFSNDGSIEAFEHRSLPIVGIMWHPEREGYGQKGESGLLRRLFLQS